MEGALAWISQIAEWLGRFIPRWEILDTSMGAVKFVRGSKAIALGPGIHWYWPVMTTFKAYPLVRQADTLREQTITTTDNRTVVVGGIIVYEVFDIVKLVALTYDPGDTIKDLSLSAIHDICCQMSWDELLTEQRKGTLDTKLKNAARRALEDYGVRAVKVMLTDLAACRVYRLIQSTNQGGLNGISH